MVLFSVCSVYEGCRLVFLFYLFIFCGMALRVAFMGHWGGTLVAFTVLSVFFKLGIGVGRLWRFSASVSFMRHAGWSVYFTYLFFVWRGVACSVYGALVWGPCGVHSVRSVYEAFGLVAFLWHLECV